MRSHCLEEALAGRLRRAPLATVGRQRAQARQGARRGLRLGHCGASPSTVCAKEAEGVLVIAGGLGGGHSSPSPDPGPRIYLLSTLPLRRQACVGISVSTACPSKLQGTWKSSTNHTPPLTLLHQLVCFSKIKFTFLKR